MNILGETIGEICKIVLPIHEDVYFGNKDSHLAICTLSSMKLLKKIAKSELLENISLAGRLLSENKGIDSMLDYLDHHRKIKTVIVCGKDVWGHRAGHSLFELHKNGLDKNNRIINSNSPDPYLTSSKYHIEHFQNNVCLINLIGKDDFEFLLDTVRKI